MVNILKLLYFNNKNIKSLGAGSVFNVISLLFLYKHILNKSLGKLLMIGHGFLGKKVFYLPQSGLENTEPFSILASKLP